MQELVLVGNDGYVKLVDWMGGDISAVNAARASYMKEVREMRPADERLLSFLSENGHTSPFRHAFVTVEIKAPIMVARQWFKYRVGSAHTGDTAELLGIEIPPEFLAAIAWGGQGDDGAHGFGDLLQGRNEASRRYITLHPDFYIPSIWRGAPASSKQGSSGAVPENISSEATKRLLEITSAALDAYEWALSAGICAEQARLFLPAYSLYTVWRWTASLQSLQHFLSQRLGHDAQSEIREYAEAVLRVTEPIFPASLKKIKEFSRE